MAAFEYLALDPSGRQQKGVLEADSARQVRQLLRERQLAPLDVKPTRTCQARLMLMAMIRATARRAGAYRCSQREEAPEKGNTSLLVFIVMSEDRRGIIAVRCR